MSIQLDELLTRSPEICGGRLRLDGTRVTVLQIATLYQQGESPEVIAEHFPQLNLGQVYTALAYYHANSDEIEADLAAERRAAEELRGAANS